MKAKTMKLIAVTCGTILVSSCANQAETSQTTLTTVGNPFLPL